MWYCSVAGVTCNFYFACCFMHWCIAIPTCNSTAKVAFQGIAVRNWWFAFLNGGIILYITVVQNWWLSICRVPGALLLRSTDDLQFELWKLYYVALLCCTVNFSIREKKYINFLSFYTWIHTFQWYGIIILAKVEDSHGDSCCNLLMFFKQIRQAAAITSATETNQP